MRPPAVSLRIRKLRRRFGIAAPKLVVRRQVSWVWWPAGVFVLVLLFVTVAWFSIQRNEVDALGRNIESLSDQLRHQNDELIYLRATAGTGQSAASIERAAQKQLQTRIAGLERENQALKEDVLLFERLMQVSGEEASVRIENFRLVPEVGGRFRYRLLLAYRPGKQAPEFRGRLQLVVNYSLDDKELQLLLPESRSAAKEYQLELKHFLRRESVFELPAGAEIKAVEASVLQGDVLKSKRLAQL